MTIVLDSSMTAEQIQNQLLKAAKEQETKQKETLGKLAQKRRKIKEAFKNNPLQLEKSPLEIQRDWRNE